MKSVWVLYERTDLDRESDHYYQNYRSGCRVFTDFEDARKAMRDHIAELAAEGNSMFPGKAGELPDLEDLVQEFNDDDLADLLPGVISFRDLLKRFLTDPGFPKNKDDLDGYSKDFPAESIETDFENDGWQDGWSVGFAMTDSDEPELICRYLDEGPDNGITPYVYINCFIMNDPDKKYSFHLANSFRDVEYRSHIFIDLEKVEIDGQNGTRPS